MSLDDQFRQVLERAIHDLVRVATEERTRAVARATEAAVADARARADAELAQIQDATQIHINDLHRTTETRVIDLTRALDRARDDARREVDEIRRLARAQDEAARTEVELRLAGLHARVVDLEARLDRLPPVLQQMDRARSLAEVLNALAQAAAGEATRAALFLVRGTRLRGWSLQGYGPGMPAARALDLEISSAGVAGDAVRSGGMITLTGTEIDSVVRPIPAAVPSALAALPLLVGGAPAAVLYVESDDESVQGTGWCAVLDVFTRHAGTVLELLTLQQVAGVTGFAPMARGSQPAVAGVSHDGGLL